MSDLEGAEGATEAEPTTGAEGEGGIDESFLEDEEQPTDEFDLRGIADKLAVERRRTTTGTLRVQRSSKDVVTLPLDRTETTIGRDPACDIVLTAPGVSGRHASLRRIETGYFQLRDLHSTNGTHVSGDPIREMILLDGDQFKIGEVRFTLEVHAVETPDDDG